MSVEYCNLCSHVISPSESVATVLRERGVTTPITSIPTGIDAAFFGGGNGAEFRRRLGIDERALVIGHVGRLAAEKNLEYLAEAVGRYLAQRSDAVFVIVGAGDAEPSIERILRDLAEPRQIYMAGRQTGQDLADAYAAMDLFVFSSKSETQGMVLAEAMAAGVPAVALDAPGAREIVNDTNGRLLPAEAPVEGFVATLAELTASRDRLRELGSAARHSAQEFSLEKCADRVLDVYGQLLHDFARRADADAAPWDRLLGRIEIEWNLIVEKTTALAAAVETDTTKAQLQ
jgi:glycosyltransferase involved in cell wall biosynthesis